MSDKTFDEIMREITAGLTGESKADLVYLRDKMEAYKEHPLAKEIIRACGRLVWELLPEGDKAELGEAFGKDEAGTRYVLEEVHFNQRAGNSGKALELIEPLATSYTEAMAEGMFEDDAVSRYFDFENIVQEMVWHAHNEEERTIRHVPVPISQVFLTYGSCLYEAGRYRDATAALGKAIRWNPAKPSIRFELGENYKKLGDMETYERVIDWAHPYIATAADMARYHRSKGFLLIEKGSLELAAAHLMYSLRYGESSMALSEVMYIKMEFGKDYTGMTPESAAETLERSGELCAANPKTVSTLYSILKLASENSDAQTAIGTAVDLYQLTGDERLGDILRASQNTVGSTPGV